MNNMINPTKLQLMIINSPKRYNVFYAGTAYGNNGIIRLEFLDLLDGGTAEEDDSETSSE